MRTSVYIKLLGFIFTIGIVVSVFALSYFDQTILEIDIFVIFSIICILIIFFHVSLIVKGKRKSHENEMLFSTFNQLDDFIIFANKDKIIESVNPAYEVITGYTKQEIVGKSLEFCVKNEIDNLDWEKIWTRINKGKVFSGFSTLLHISGEKKYIERKIIPIYDKKGKICNFIMIGKDMTNLVLFQDSLSHLASFPEQNPNPIIEIDKIGNILYFNSAANNAFPSLIENKLDHPTLKEIYNIILKLNENPIEHFTNEIQLDVRYYREEISYITDKDLYRIFFFDITNKKKGEEALKLSEERFRTVADFTYDWEYWMGPDNKFVWMSPSVEFYTGYKNDDFYNDPSLIIKIVHKDFQELFSSHITKLSSEEVASIDILVITKSNEQKWFSHICQPVFNKEGAFLGRRASNRDITERKAAEDQVQKAAALLDITQEAIVVRDLSFKIEFWNTGAEKLYGWTKEEAIGKDLRTLIYKDIQPSIVESQNITINSGKWTGEIIQKTKNNKDIIVQSRWVLIKSEDDVPKAILTVSTDITEKKQLEKQFLHAQRMESVGRIAGGVAHDFNNMLAAITSSLEILDLKIKDDPNKKYLEIIKQATERGADLARQLLAFARLETYTIKPVQINDIIFETVKLIEHTFQKTIEIKTNLDLKLPLIDGDRGRLSQVLLNLCVNARDAMSKGGILSIESALEYIDDNKLDKPLDLENGEYVKIMIKDTGHGIDEQTRQKIFEPFFTTKEKGKGTGLGLSIVYGVIESHKGFITVDSTIGIGTTFNIFFPKSLYSLKENDTQGKQNIIGGTETILLVDDEQIILSLGSELLSSLKYKVLTAENGKKAIELYMSKKNEIDIVILDVMMPKINGEETFKILKEINSNIKVIIASGFHELEIRNRLEQLGIKQFIQKPFKIAEMAKSIREVLDNK